MISLTSHVESQARSVAIRCQRSVAVRLSPGSGCPLINRSSDAWWWEVQLRTLSSAQAAHAQCSSGSCSFHKNSQFPAFPEEEVLKVPGRSVGWGGNQGLEPRCPSAPGWVTGRHRAQSHRSPHSSLQAVFVLLLECRSFFFFFFPFCSDHVVPVTRAIWHTCRKNTPGSCQLLGRENVLGCLKYASHVDFLIICLVFKAKYSGTVKTCQHLVDFAAELINRFWWRGMRIKGMCLERHSLFGNLIFLYLSLLFLIFWYSIININSTGHVCFNSCGF